MIHTCLPSSKSLKCYEALQGKMQWKHLCSPVIPPLPPTTSIVCVAGGGDSKTLNLETVTESLRFIKFHFELNPTRCSHSDNVKLQHYCWWSGSFLEHQSHIGDIRMYDNYAPLKRAAPYKSDHKHWLVLCSKWNYCELGAAPEHVPSCSLVIWDVNISD